MKTTENDPSGPIRTSPCWMMEPYRFTSETAEAAAREWPLKLSTLPEILTVSPGKYSLSTLSNLTS